MTLRTDTPHGLGKAAIRAASDGNLCGCTVRQNIVTAVAEAAMYLGERVRLGAPR